MISVKLLREIARETGLLLYQQEKDYMLKLFLYNYFKNFDSAIFKGGTCIKYLFGLERFSEDLDFNINISPEKFQKQVEKTLKEISSMGMETYLIKEEKFKESYTCEVGFHGPLYKGIKQTRNKIRIDAGRRIGVINDPEWKLIASEYPETKEYFLVKVMNEEEMMVEKVISLMERGKGRDLYDVWFLLKKGVKLDRELFRRKASSKAKWSNLPSESEYKRDLEKLTGRVIPFSQVIKEVEEGLKVL
ncbi:MAG: nucleotidyl transferase AbiEii/AbiGii toxin family protein [Candidatus Thermoplasmatota archaeon]|nr:nucleotidyl transferase AbiEii/AbiGii toxin family protein [Candidatus Thermoplasmatota archaeon]